MKKLIGDLKKTVGKVLLFAATTGLALGLATDNGFAQRGKPNPEEQRKEPPRPKQNLPSNKQQPDQKVQQKPAPKPGTHVAKPAPKLPPPPALFPQYHRHYYDLNNQRRDSLYNVPQIYWNDVFALQSRKKYWNGFFNDVYLYQNRPLSYWLTSGNISPRYWGIVIDFSNNRKNIFFEYVNYYNWDFFLGLSASRRNNFFHVLNNDERRWFRDNLPYHYWDAALEICATRKRTNIFFSLRPAERLIYATLNSRERDRFLSMRGRR